VESLLQESSTSFATASLRPFHGVALQNGPGVELVTRALRGINNPFPVPHSDDLSFVEIEETLESLSLSNGDSRGFQGKSSQAMLIKAAVELKGRAFTLARPSKPWSINPVRFYSL
jgi:hypothetical protein